MRLSIFIEQVINTRYFGDIKMNTKVNTPELSTLLSKANNQLKANLKAVYPVIDEHIYIMGEDDIVCILDDLDMNESDFDDPRLLALMTVHKGNRYEIGLYVKLMVDSFKAIAHSIKYVEHLVCLNKSVAKDIAKLEDELCKDE